MYYLCCCLETLFSALIILCMGSLVLGWQNRKNNVWVPPFYKNSALLPWLYPLAVFVEHKHRPNGVSDVSPFLSYSASHAQMFCSLLLYSSQHCFLSSCCCAMPLMLQRQ